VGRAWNAKYCGTDKEWGKKAEKWVNEMWYPMADARVFAKSLTLNAPLTQKGAKTILNGLAFGRGSLDLQHAERLIAQAAASEDYREGRKAFAARRAPDFQGR
jgi:enoyl-CoA hydratase/carnithine racemase